MRKAVVDVFELSDLDTGQRAAKRAGWTHIAQGMLMKDGNSAGKLTKEDIDKALAASAREEYGYDVVPGPTRKRCFLAGLRAMGIDVEDGNG